MIYFRFSIITFPVDQKFTYTQLVFGSITYKLFNLGQTSRVAFHKLPTISWVNFGPFLLTAGVTESGLQASLLAYGFSVLPTKCLYHLQDPDSTALVSRMTASAGSPTTSLEFSVPNRRACCLDLWQSLWGCHRVQFSGRIFSIYIIDVALAAGDSLIHLYADNAILCTSGPSLDTVLTNLQTSFNDIQLSFCGLQLL